MLVANFVNTTSFWTNYADGWIWFIGGLITAVGYIWNQHRKALKREVKEEIHNEIDNDVIKKIAEEIADIKHETSHNGGSSMKDLVRRVQQEQEEGFRKQEERMEQLERYIQKLDKALEYHFGLHKGMGM